MEHAFDTDSLFKILIPSDSGFALRSSAWAEDPDPWMYSSPILSALIFSDIRNPSGKFQYITSQETRYNTDGEKKKKKELISP